MRGSGISRSLPVFRPTLNGARESDISRCSAPKTKRTTGKVVVLGAIRLLTELADELAIVCFLEPTIVLHVGISTGEVLMPISASRLVRVGVLLCLLAGLG